MKSTILYIDHKGANLRTFRSPFRRAYEILTASRGGKRLQVWNHEKLKATIASVFPN